MGDVGQPTHIPRGFAVCGNLCSSNFTPTLQIQWEYKDEKEWVGGEWEEEVVVVGNLRFYLIIFMSPRQRYSFGW